MAYLYDTIAGIPDVRSWQTSQVISLLYSHHRYRPVISKTSKAFQKTPDCNDADYEECSGQNANPQYL